MLMCYRIIGLGCFAINAYYHALTVTTKSVNAKKPKGYGRLRYDVMESTEISEERAAPIICVEAEAK
jgi:hypothetical protein